MRTLKYVIDNVRYTVARTKASGKYPCGAVLLCGCTRRNAVVRNVQRARIDGQLLLSARALCRYCGQWWWPVVVFLSSRAWRVRFEACILLRRQNACRRGTTAVVYFDSAALVVPAANWWEKWRNPSSHTATRCTL